MRFLGVFLFLSFLSLAIIGEVHGGDDDKNGNLCIKDKLPQIQEIGLLSGNLGAASDVKARLDACDPSAPLTLFIPNNEAVMGAISRLKAPNPEAGSVGALNEEQKQLLGALAAYHITAANASTAQLMNNGVSVLNTTMANRPQFVELGQKGVPQRLLVVAGAGVNKTASALLSMQKNKHFWNGTSKIVLDQQFKGPNDAMIVKKDIKCKDGYIHVIDKVLLLPKNATEQLYASNLTGFALLVKIAETGRWLDNLSGVTIFAPTNKALRQLDAQLANQSITIFGAKAPYQSFYQTKKVAFAKSEDEMREAYKNILSLPHEKLLKLVRSHVFQGVKYSTGFQENSVMMNYNNTEYTFQNLNKTAGKVPQSNSFRSVLARFLAQHDDQSTNIANAIGNIPISFANIFTRNGAIHVINGVLGPNITTPGKGKPATPPSTTPGTVIPASNTTAPTVQAQSVGIACVNGTMLASLDNITAKSNTTLNTSNGPFQVIINAPVPDCPPSDQLCMVATLSNTCSVPPSPFQQSLPTDLITAKPSEVNAAYANSITFTPRCFNPNTHVCVNNHFLCPISHPSLCGDACYSSQQYKCFAKFSMCPTHAPNLCGEACYDQNQYQCQRGTLKQKGQAGQGGQGGQGANAKNKNRGN